MSDVTYELIRRSATRIDRAWLVSGAIVAILALTDFAQVLPTLNFTAEQLLNTAPYVLFAILTVAYLKASGAETIVARAFEGREVRMIILAALFGGLAPFCSCEVIPFVAGLLALGTPLSAVMAFWLASPVMDPPAFLITAGALGWSFAIGKTVAAVGMGLMGGFAIKLANQAGWFINPLQADAVGSSCGCGPSPFSGKPVWRFWEDPGRRSTFYSQAVENGLFLFKWLTLAYLLESLMITYIPAEAIAGIVGGNGILAIMASALIGAPAYLNSYAAPPLVAGLMEQGMSAGGGMAFMVAGAVSCIPAMTAVFALVRRTVFAAYVGLGFIGAVVSGIIFGTLVDLAII